MKVYVISEYFPYEGSDIVEVWDNEEAANRRARELGEEKAYSEHLVKEYEVKGIG